MKSLDFTETWRHQHPESYRCGRPRRDDDRKVRQRRTVVPDNAAGSPASYEKMDTSAKRRFRKGRGMNVPLNLAGLLVFLPSHPLHHTNDLAGVCVHDSHQFFNGKVAVAS